MRVGMRMRMRMRMRMDEWMQRGGARVEGGCCCLVGLGGRADDRLEGDSVWGFRLRSISYAGCFQAQTVPRMRRERGMHQDESEGVRGGGREDEGMRVKRYVGEGKGKKGGWVEKSETSRHHGLTRYK